MQANCNKDFIFVRHGKSVANSGLVIQGRIDSPLSEEGKEQASQTGRLISRLYRKIDRIYTSPLSRAFETAQIIANHVGYPLKDIIVVDELIEASFGDWEGKTPQEVIREDPELFYMWLENPSKVIPPNGEGFEKVRERISKAMENIRKKEAGKTVIVVGHAASFSAYLNFLYGFPPESLWKIALGNASISILSNQSYETPPLLKTLNSYFHLENLDIFIKKEEVRQW